MDQNSTTKHLLLVDDNRNVLSADQEILENAGYSVTAARAPDEAIGAFAKNPQRFHVVITDKRLKHTEKNGLWVTREVKRISPQTPVIVITQYGDKDGSHEALSAGATRYIHRQSDSCDLLNVIETLDDAEALKKAVDALVGSHWGRQIINESGVGIAIVDRAFRLVYVNREMRHISAPGITTGGVCWHEYNGATLQREPCSWCAVQKLFSKPEWRTKPADFEENPPRQEALTVSDKDGKAHFYAVTATPLYSEDGRLIGAVEAVRDITESHELTATSVQELIPQLLRRVQQVAICSRVRLFLLSPDKQYLVGRQALGQYKHCPDLSKIRLPLRRDLCSRVTLSTKEIRIFGPNYEGRNTDYDEQLEIGGLQRMEIPLIPKGGNEAIGKVVLDHLGSGRNFEEKDKENRMLHLFAEGLATAVQQTREEEAKQSRIKHLENLREFERQLATASDHDARMQKALDLCKQFLDADWGHIRVSRTGALILLPGGDSVYAKRLALGRVDASSGLSASAKILADPEHNPVIVNYAPNEPYHQSIRAKILAQKDLSEAERNSLLESWDQMVACATFGLLDGAEILGTLSLQSRHSDFFTEEKIRLAKDFVDRTAQWARYDRLLERRQVRIRQLEELARIEADMQHDDIDGICSRAVMGMCSADGPNCSRAAVFLRENTGAFCWRAYWWPSDDPYGAARDCCVKGTAATPAKDFTVPLLKCILFEATRGNGLRDKPFVVGETDSDWQSILKQLPAREAVVVPLVARGDFLGVIVADLEFQRWRKLDKELLNLLGLYASNVAETLKTEMLIRQFLKQAAHQLVTPAAAAFNAFEDLMLNKAASVAWTTLENELRLNVSETEKLMHFARIESASLTMDWDKVDIAELVRINVTLGFRQICSARTKTIETEIPIRGNWEIVADKAKVNGILSPLVDNALRYSEEGTPVTVRLDSQSDFVIISVINDGPGMSAETLGLLKQSESQFSPLGVSLALENPKGGLGIGFTIARRLAEAHDGAVEIVESRSSRTEIQVKLKREPGKPSERNQNARESKENTAC